MLRWLCSLLQHLCRAADGHQGAGDSGDEVDPDDPESWLSLDYIHDQVAEKLKQQYEALNVIDGRLRLILGVIGIIFAAALGLQRSPAPIPFWVGVLAIAAMTMFLVAGILAARRYPSLDFDWPPQPESLREEFLLADPREAKLAVVDTAIDAYNQNRNILATKIWAFNVAFALTAVATVLMGLAVIAQLGCQTAAPEWWPWPGHRC
jgi:hypothetical protein